MLSPPVLIAAALLVLALRGREAPERIDPAEMATTARVLSIAPTPFTPRVSGFGVVEPARRWSATAQVAGRIAAPTIDAAVVAPRSAIHDGAVLLADAQDRLRRQPVEVAMEAEDAALIASGLSPGDRVVLTDLPAAVEGMLLRPVEDDAAAARLRRAAAP